MRLVLPLAAAAFACSRSPTRDDSEGATVEARHEAAIVADARPGTVVDRVVVSGGEVYWIERPRDGDSAAALQLAHRTGGAVDRVAVRSAALAADDGAVYYVAADGRVVRRAHDGGAAIAIGTLPSITEIAVAGARVLALQVTGTRATLWRLDGDDERAAQTKLLEASSLGAPVVHGNRVYLTRNGATTASVSIAGTDEVLLSSEACWIHVDDRYVYLSGSTGITRVPTRTGTIADTESFAAGFVAIGGDARNLYAVGPDGLAAIDKATQAVIPLLAANPPTQQAVAGPDGLYLSQGNRIVKLDP
jgi:hypothetical protein